MTSTVGSIAKQVYRWNSIFDVDLTGGGHQPLYHDTYAAIYNNYTVVKARARIKFINTSTAPVIVGLTTDDNSTSATNVDTLSEQNHGRQEILPPISGALSVKQFHDKWDFATWFNVNPLSADSVKTTIGTDPNDISALVCFMQTLDASTASCYIEAEIVQEVLFSELLSPSQS
jgi:hypothetical protein